MLIHDTIVPDAPAIVPPDAIEPSGELLEAYRAIQQYNQKPGFWYLATPYTKYPEGIEAAFRDAALVAGALLATDVNVYAPIVHGHVVADAGRIIEKPLSYWLEIDTPFMLAATGIIVAKLPSWEISDGIAREIAFFKALRKPVVYLPIIKSGNVDA